MENKLLKEIEEDKTLQELTKALKETMENAQSINLKIETRENQLKDKLENYDKYVLPIYTSDIDSIEAAIDSSESQANIARKIIALQRAKQIPWTEDEKYREAMHQYFIYLIPIMQKLEIAKSQSRRKIAEINARYRKELQEATNELNLYKNKIIKLFEVASENGPWLYQEDYVKQFGRIARADNFAIHIADMYKQREAKESAPNITKHQSLDGIQYITDTRP